MPNPAHACISTVFNGPATATGSNARYYYLYVYVIDCYHYAEINLLPNTAAGSFFLSFLSSTVITRVYHIRGTVERHRLKGKEGLTTDIAASRWYIDK